MIKPFLLIIILLTSIAAQAQYSPVFTEDFNKTKNLWKIEKKKDVTTTFAYSTIPSYEVDNESVVDYFSLVVCPINEQNNYKIEASTDQLFPQGENGYGIMFGAKDEKNGYIFTINHNGCFKLLNAKSGKLTELKKGYVRKPASHYDITIECAKGRWDFMLNGLDAYNCPLQPFVGNMLGFYISAGQQLICQKLTVSEQSPAANVDQNIVFEPKDLYTLLDKVMCHTDSGFKKLLKDTSVVTATNPDPKNAEITYTSKLFLPGGGSNSFFLTKVPRNHSPSTTFYTFYPDFKDKNEAMILYEKVLALLQVYQPSCYALSKLGETYNEKDDDILRQDFWQGANTRLKFYLRKGKDKYVMLVSVTPGS